MALAMLGAGLSKPLPAQEADRKTSLIEPEAMTALHSMGAYLRSLKDFQVEAAITSEDVMDNGEKVQYSQTTNILAHPPNQLRADINGEQKSRLLLFDGKSFTMFARKLGFYATVPAPPTIGELIDVLTDKYEIEVPLVDLFYWGGPDDDSKDITSARDIGPATIEDVTCEHYAFRQPGADWQIWIQLGEHPLPLKLVITNTEDEGRPQYESVLTWNLAPSYNAAAFVFDPPDDAHRIVIAEAQKEKTQK